MIVSSPVAAMRTVVRSLRAAVGWISGQARHQFIPRNRRVAFGLTLVTVAIAVAAVHLSAWWFSPGVMILPILCGGLLLWPRALRILFVIAGICLVYDVAEDKAGAGIVATIPVTPFFPHLLS